MLDCIICCSQLPCAGAQMRGSRLLSCIRTSARLVLEPDVGDLLGGQHQRRVDDAAAAGKALRDAGDTEEQRRRPAPVIDLPANTGGRWSTECATVSESPPPHKCRHSRASESLSALRASLCSDEEGRPVAALKSCRDGLTRPLLCHFARSSPSAPLSRLVSIPASLLGDGVSAGGETKSAAPGG